MRLETEVILNVPDLLDYYRNHPQVQLVYGVIHIKPGFSWEGNLLKEALVRVNIQPKLIKKVVIRQLKQEGAPWWKRLFI